MKKVIFFFLTVVCCSSYCQSNDVKLAIEPFFAAGSASWIAKINYMDVRTGSPNDPLSLVVSNERVVRWGPTFTAGALAHMTFSNIQLGVSYSLQKIDIDLRDSFANIENPTAQNVQLIVGVTVADGERLTVTPQLGSGISFMQNTGRNPFLLSGGVQLGFQKSERIAFNLTPNLSYRGYQIRRLGDEKHTILEAAVKVGLSILLN